MDSKVLKEGLRYRKGGNNKKLRELLTEEQGGFCAYTGKRFSATEKGEIDHFDPNLKETQGDSYQNWFVCVAYWNRRKGGKSRWAKFKPVLHPTDDAFEERVIYANGGYEFRAGDLEAENLIELLFLNDHELTKERKALISQLRKLIGGSLALVDDIKEVLVDYPHLYNFPRALRAEFPELEQTA